MPDRHTGSMNSCCTLFMSADLGGYSIVTCLSIDVFRNMMSKYFRTVSAWCTCAQLVDIIVDTIYQQSEIIEHVFVHLNYYWKVGTEYITCNITLPNIEHLWILCALLHMLTKSRKTQYLEFWLKVGSSYIVYFISKRGISLQMFIIMCNDTGARVRFFHLNVRICILNGWIPLFQFQNFMQFSVY